MSAELFHIESEQCVIGGLLIDPNAFDRIDFLVEADFYREDHRLIFRHIALMLAERKPVDVVTVAESLKSAGAPEDQTGLAYLGELAMNTPSAANIRRYAEVVSEKRGLRDLLAVADQISNLAQRETSMPVAQRIDEAQAVVFALAEHRARSGNDDAEAVGSILADVVADIHERFDNGGRIAGLPTGFADIDEKTCGLNGGDLVIVAGRPSMGKTAFALNIAENVAVHEGKPVAVFSMEMSKKQLTERSIASLGGISMSAIRSGKLVDDDFGRMSAAIGRLHKAPLYIVDTAALTITQMRSRARRMARKDGLSLIVVDYIQLARGDSASTKNGNREQEVSSISRGLKALAKEFDCPVIALSQLNRKVDDRTDKRPMMSDLRDSGAIEQDADVILMMYREDYYKPDTPDAGIAEVIIGKQRMGETGTVPLLFQGQFSRFRNLTASAKADLEYARKNARELAATAKPMKRRGFD